MKQSVRVYVVLFLLLVGICPALRAQQASPETGTNSVAEQIAAFQLQLTNAWQRVLAIVNQPVTAYRLAPGYHVSVYPGWFHSGAIIPDFEHVDVRKTQELVYTNEYVTSTLNPGLMFRGSDLEFNPNTKYFYRNTSFPKHRLSEKEMLEINQLYRVIGRCRHQIMVLQDSVRVKAAESADAGTGAEASDSPKQSFESIRRIPRQTRILYGSIGIGALIILVVIIRLFRKKPG